MPKWINKYICGYLAKLLRMQIPFKLGVLDPNDILETKPSSYVPYHQDVNAKSSKSLLANVLDINDDYLNRGCNNFKSSFKLSHHQDNDENGDEFYSNDPNLVKRNLGAILKELKVLTKKIDDDDEDEEKILGWKFAAMVVDRLCMVVFTISTVIATVVILLTSKNFFRLQ